MIKLRVIVLGKQEMSLSALVNKSLLIFMEFKDLNLLKDS